MPWLTQMSKPERAPDHQVENLNDTVAIAGNFADALNWEAFVAEQKAALLLSAVSHGVPDSLAPCRASNWRLKPSS